MSDSTPTLDDAPAFLRRVASQIRTYSDMRGAERLERIAAALDASGNDELVEALLSVLPRNVCLTNRNVPDSTIVPLETTMGELRRIAAIARTQEQSDG